jgi:hypothetical protein
MSGDTDFENLLQLTITFVKQLLEVVWKLKIITELDGYLSEMVDSYVSI